VIKTKISEEEMKRFYLRFRITLMTFALGLASVFVFSGTLQNSDETPVDLPKTETAKTLVVFPKYEGEIPYPKGRPMFFNNCSKGIPKPAKKQK
jgi:hypothetical protein